MNRKIKVRDWKSTVKALIGYPYRKPLPRSAGLAFQALIAQLAVRKIFYLGHESPSMLDLLQNSALEQIYYSSKHDWWGIEGAWWDEELAARPSRGVFLGDKVFRMIEGNPQEFDGMVLDEMFSEYRLANFDALLDSMAKDNPPAPRLIILSDMQEQDGPLAEESLLLRHQWRVIRGRMIRCADSPALGIYDFSLALKNIEDAQQAMAICKSEGIEMKG